MRQVGRQAVGVVLALAVMVGVAGAVRVTALNKQEQEKLREAARHVHGAVIVVDPGHGGEDPGAVVGSTVEKTIALDIALALRTTLEGQGARVILTRDSDVDLGGRLREELGRRVALITKHNAHVYVSIHANKDACACKGAQVFYQRNGLPAGRELAVAIQNQLLQRTWTKRTALPADYFVLRTSPVPAAMVEVGFLTHAGELQKLKDPGYHKVLAAAIAIGISDFLRTQVPPAKSQGQVGD